MVVSRNPKAPLFAVVGATGVQGGSTIHAIAASSREYRVRALTRDPSSEAAQNLAQTGCDVVPADVSDSDSLTVAFQGCEIAFTMTTSIGGSPDREWLEGKAQLDAAKSQGVKTIAWAGEEDIAALGGGKRTVHTYASKNKVSIYGHVLDGVKFYDVQPGSYASNYLPGGWYAPRKGADGTWTLSLPFEEDTKLPMVDMKTDYGRYVVAAIETGKLSTVRAAREYLTPPQIAAAFSSFAGVPVNFQVFPDEALRGMLAPELQYVVDMFACFREAGYYGGAELEASNEILDPPARSFEETLVAHKDELGKHFAD